MNEIDGIIITAIIWFFMAIELSFNIFGIEKWLEKHLLGL